MKTENFLNLISALTGREFKINTSDLELIPDKKYFIFKITPILNRHIGFDFKTPLNEEKIIKSFVTTFCNKYREPNPANYTGVYCGQYNKSTDWNFMPDKNKEYCYSHHSSNMYSKSMLLEQIKENLNDKSIENILCKYGFYETIYGIGIFVLFSGIREMNAIKKMTDFLNQNNIPFRNEFSEARWVYRFVINIDKDSHKSLLNKFNSLY